MAGKSLQRDKKIKDNQSTITHFFSKKTATHDQNSPKQQTDPTEQEIQIKSSYFSPEKNQNSTNYPLRNLCKRRLSLRKFQGRFYFFHSHFCLKDYGQNFVGINLIKKSITYTRNSMLN